MCEHVKLQTCHYRKYLDIVPPRGIQYFVTLVFFLFRGLHLFLVSAQWPSLQSYSYSFPAQHKHARVSHVMCRGSVLRSIQTVGSQKKLINTSNTLLCIKRIDKNIMGIRGRTLSESAVFGRITTQTASHLN